MDLSKIGKCELCVLAKQVRARMIEIGEKAKDTGTWDQELMDEYEECAETLERFRDEIQRLESRKCQPIHTMADSVAGVYELYDKERADYFVEAHREEIRHALRLIGVGEVSPEGERAPL